MLVRLSGPFPKIDTLAGLAPLAGLKQLASLSATVFQIPALMESIDRFNF